MQKNLCADKADPVNPGERFEQVGLGSCKVPKAEKGGRGPASRTAEVLKLPRQNSDGTR